MTIGISHGQYILVFFPLRTLDSTGFLLEVYFLVGRLVGDFAKDASIVGLSVVISSPNTPDGFMVVGTMIDCFLEGIAVGLVLTGCSVEG